MCSELSEQSNVKLYSLYSLYEMQKPVQEDEIPNSMHKDGEYIGIPAVQRGLVWEPSKIVNLWDSIVKGYPIGIFQCYLENQGGRVIKCLIDGQQRLNAICLGFENSEEASLWVGLSKEEDAEKPVFMVCTRRHPWGYKRTHESAGDKLTVFSAAERSAKNNFLLAKELKSNKNYEKSYNEFSIADFNIVGEPVPNPDEVGITYYPVPDILSKEPISNAPLYTAIRNSSWARQVRDATYNIVPVVSIPQFTPTPSNLRELFARINRGGSPLSTLDELYSAACVYVNLKEINRTLAKGFLPPERLTRIAARMAKSAISKKYEDEVSIEELCKWFNKDILSTKGKILQDLYNSDLNTPIAECKESFIKLIGKDSTSIPSYIYLRNKEDNWLYVIFFLLYNEKTKNILKEGKAFFPLFCLLPDVMCGTNAVNGKKKFCEAFFNAIVKDSVQFHDILHLMAIGCVAASLDDTFMWPYPDELNIAAPSKKEPSDYSTYWLDIYRSIYGRADNNLLYYYQREYVNQMLSAGNFDPAAPSTWQGKDNKPWDFDHVIPESWWENDPENIENEIGNMQIMYFSHNRSKGNHQSGAPDNISKHSQLKYFRYERDSDYNKQARESNKEHTWTNLVRLRQYDIIKSVCNELHIFSLINVIRELYSDQSSSAIVERAKERLQNLYSIAKENNFNQWGICTYEWKQQNKSTREVTWLPIEKMDFYKSLAHWVIVGKEINIADIPVLLSVQAHISLQSENIQYTIGLSRPIGLSEREWNAMCTKARENSEKYRNYNSWFLVPEENASSFEEAKAKLATLFSKHTSDMNKSPLHK